MRFFIVAAVFSVFSGSADAQNPEDTYPAMRALHLARSGAYAVISNGSDGSLNDSSAYSIHGDSIAERTYSYSSGQTEETIYDQGGKQLRFRSDKKRMFHDYDGNEITLQIFGGREVYISLIRFRDGGMKKEELYYSGSRKNGFAGKFDSLETIDFSDGRDKGDIKVKKHVIYVLDIMSREVQVVTHEFGKSESDQKLIRHYDGKWNLLREDQYNNRGEYIESRIKRYDRSGRETEEIEKDSSSRDTYFQNDTLRRITRTYDKRGNLLSVHDFQEDGQQWRTIFAYDSKGLLKEKTEKYWRFSRWFSETVKYFYDEKGNVSKEVYSSNDDGGVSTSVILFKIFYR